MADNTGQQTNVISYRTTEDANGHHNPHHKMAFGANGEVIQVNVDNPLPVTNYWITHAKHLIMNQFGHTIEVHAKHKDLLKFGRNNLVGTSEATIMTLPSGVLNETYISSNLITTVSSSSGSDTGVILVEGHTVAAGVFTFVEQSITLTGQTQATLATPLARVSRVTNDGSSDLIGSIYIYEDDTSASGVPDTDVLVHLIVEAGHNNSEKVSVTMSGDEYWLVSSFYGDCLEKTSSFASISLETRLAGKTFVDKISISATTGSHTFHKFEPFLIVRPNSDIRLVGVADGANTAISGGIQGVLAAIV